MKRISRSFFFLFLVLSSLCLAEEEPLLYWWNEEPFINFGDYLSLKLVERIVGKPVRTCRNPKTNRQKKLLAIGSILSFARDHDVIWGAGINGKLLKKQHYRFNDLDVRAVRGPLTRKFLQEQFQIESPEVYGDPALLLPYFFPEFRRKQHPKFAYVIIPHYSECKLFPKTQYPEAVFPTEPWDQIIEKILDSQFVIASSLHGIIVAEAFGIPARMLRVSEKEHLIKYTDYYSGTNRPYFEYATSIEEALRMGGEVPPQCDLQKIYETFPFDLWPDTEFQQPDFTNNDIAYEKPCFARL